MSAIGVQESAADLGVSEVLTYFWILTAKCKGT